VTARLPVLFYFLATRGLTPGRRACSSSASSRHRTGLQESSPLEIDQHRGIRHDHDRHESRHSRLIHTARQLPHGKAENLGDLRFTNGAFGERAEAQALHPPRLLLRGIDRARLFIGRLTAANVAALSIVRSPVFRCRLYHPRRTHVAASA
jgi:hypothetical protein